MPKHIKNVTSAGSYSVMQIKNSIKNRVVGGAKMALGPSCATRLKKGVRKSGQDSKHKTSNTFGDLSTISTLISKLESYFWG